MLKLLISIYATKSCSCHWLPFSSFRLLGSEDCDMKHYFFCSTPSKPELVCPKGFMQYKGRCIYQSSTLTNLENAKHECAELGSIVLPIKDNGMFEFIKALSIATQAKDVFVGMNLTTSPGVYSDNTEFNEAIFDYQGASVKFSLPCVYLKRGINFQARGTSCLKEFQFYCIWKGSFFNTLNMYCLFYFIFKHFLFLPLSLMF